MTDWCIQHQNEFSEAARYVFRTLGAMIGVEWRETNVPEAAGNVLVYYGSEPPRTARPLIFIPQANASLAAKIAGSDVIRLECCGQDLRLPSENYAFFMMPTPLLDQPLYCDAVSSQPVISRYENRIHFGFDLIALCYYFLTLQNEAQAEKRDGFGRFQRSFSPLGEAIYDYPVVDRYATLLRLLLKMISPALSLQPLWPENRPFALALSHDVDRIQTWTFRKARRALRSFRSTNTGLLRRTAQLTRSLLQPENWLGNFSFITELEQSYGAGSTVFMVSRSRHKLDPSYRLNSWRIRRAVRLINRQGRRIQLHGSIPSAKSEAFLSEERRLLQHAVGQPVTGGRQHYLCFDQETPGGWLEAGLLYDSTLGFSYNTGYRCGTSFPFHLHDGKKELPILEIPLILMDTVLFLESKRHLSAEQAWKVIERHLQETRSNHGLLTLNWHNSDLHPHDLHGYSQLYERILDWTRRENGWPASLDEVYEWWTKK